MAKKDAPVDVSCSYASRDESAMPVEHLQPLFETRTVTGRPIASRLADDWLSERVVVMRRWLLIFVHVVGIPSATGGFKPIRDQAYVREIFDTADEIWSQACIKLVPIFAPLVTTFRDMPISAFAGTCLAPTQAALVEPLDLTVEGATLINLYLVEDTTGDACGSPITGHVIMPTAGLTSERLGKVLAHEIGHLLLNPLGIDDSDNPDHLMYHPERHEEAVGSRDGLFLSDCLGAHARVLEHDGAWASTGKPWAPSSEPCYMRPRLGNNLYIIQEMQT